MLVIQMLIDIYVCTHAYCVIQEETIRSVMDCYIPYASFMGISLSTVLAVMCSWRVNNVHDLYHFGNSPAKPEL